MADPATDRQGSGLGEAARRGARWAAIVAGVFTLAVSALMAWNHLQGVGLRPEDSLQIAQLKETLAADRRNETLKEQVRAVDLGLRRDFFERQAFAARGTWLLAGGLIVFLIAAKTAASLGQALPKPGPAAERGAEARAGAAGRLAVGAVGVIVGVAFAVLAIASWPGLPPEAAAGPKPEPPPKRPAVPSAEEYAKHWPRFRGPGGLGISAYTNIPTKWSGKTGEGVLWKSPVPLKSPNSPVVWGDRIFVSGATRDRREVYCFGLKDGTLLWTGKAEGIAGSPAKAPKVMADTSFAAPTVATDGLRVYAIFANGDLAAFDFAGKRVWAKSLGKPENDYGHASSLTTWRDRVIVLMDQGLDDDDKSKLMAFDGFTGERLWVTVRPVGSTWATPTIIRAAGRDQIITVAVPFVIAYNAEDGKELWRADILDGEIAPSPVFANGHVLVSQAYAVAAAIRPDGSGDVTKTHVAWKAEDGLPETCSPLATDDILFLLDSGGLMTCYDVKTGKKLWEHEDEKAPGHYLASPSLVGDKILVFTDKGVAQYFAAGREAKELGRCELGEKIMASPAFVDGRMILRSDKHLICIGKE